MHPSYKTVYQLSALLRSAIAATPAQSFAASPDLREAMQKAGVIGKPDISFLR